MTAADEIEELRQRIRKADDQYYNDGESDLTDAQYDEMFVKLRKLDCSFNQLQVRACARAQDFLPACRCLLTSTSQSCQSTPVLVTLQSWKRRGHGLLSIQVCSEWCWRRPE